jgi:hypothetical protein
MASLRFRAFDDIGEADLQALIDDGAEEDRYLDFKRDQLGGSDGDKKELLADVSSFANSSGGHIVFGMDEDDTRGLGVGGTGVGVGVRATRTAIASSRLGSMSLALMSSSTAATGLPLASKAWVLGSNGTKNRSKPGERYSLPRASPTGGQRRRRSSHRGAPPVVSRNNRQERLAAGPLPRLNGLAYSAEPPPCSPLGSRPPEDIARTVRISSRLRLPQTMRALGATGHHRRLATLRARTRVGGSITAIQCCPHHAGGAVICGSFVGVGFPPPR